MLKQGGFPSASYPLAGETEQPYDMRHEGIHDGCIIAGVKLQPPARFKLFWSAGDDSKANP